MCHVYKCECFVFVCSNVIYCPSLFFISLWLIRTASSSCWRSGMRICQICGSSPSGWSVWRFWASLSACLSSPSPTGSCPAARWQTHTSASLTLQMRRHYHTLSSTSCFKHTLIHTAVDDFLHYACFFTSCHFVFLLSNLFNIICWLLASVHLFFHFFILYNRYIYLASFSIKSEHIWENVSIYYIKHLCLQY